MTEAMEPVRLADRFSTDPTARRWVGRIFLRPGRLLYVGAIGSSDVHAHHAFQIARGLSGPIRLIGALGETLDASAAVIPPDTAHATAAATASGWILYVDPDDAVGRGLRRTVAAGASPLQWAEAAQPLLALAGSPPSCWQDVEALELAVLDALAVPRVLPRPLHPAVGRAMRWIVDNLHSEVSLAAAAAAARSSPGRLSHLFTEEIGISFRRYVLWRRLMRAGREVQDGASFTSAAHAAGFADSPHMNHTFRKMFGLAPTDVHRAVEWVVVADDPARSSG